MKIEKDSNFSPIKITLQTEKEAAQLFALLNFVPIRKALDIEENDWDKISHFLGGEELDYSKWHNKLRSGWKE